MTMETRCINQIPETSQIQMNSVMDSPQGVTEGIEETKDVREGTVDVESRDATDTKCSDDSLARVSSNINLRNVRSRATRFETLSMHTNETREVRNILFKSKSRFMALAYHMPRPMINSNTHTRRRSMSDRDIDMRISVGDLVGYGNLFETHKAVMPGGPLRYFCRNERTGPCCSRCFSLCVNPTWVGWFRDVTDPRYWVRFTITLIASLLLSFYNMITAAYGLGDGNHYLLSLIAYTLTICSSVIKFVFIKEEFGRALSTPYGKSKLRENVWVPLLSVVQCSFLSRYCSYEYWRCQCTTEQRHLAPGTLIKIVNLHENADMNGRAGHVIEFDRFENRYSVDIDLEEYSVSRVNLLVISDPHGVGTKGSHEQAKRVSVNIGKSKHGDSFKTTDDNTNVLENGDCVRIVNKLSRHYQKRAIVHSLYKKSKDDDDRGQDLWKVVMVDTKATLRVPCKSLEIVEKNVGRSVDAIDPGDTVIITKEGSSQRGKVAIVIGPSWYPHVKVLMKHTHSIKSYLPTQLRVIEKSASSVKASGKHELTAKEVEYDLGEWMKGKLSRFENDESFRIEIKKVYSNLKTYRSWLQSTMNAAILRARISAVKWTRKKDKRSTDAFILEKERVLEYKLLQYHSLGPFLVISLLMIVDKILAQFAAAELIIAQTGDEKNDDASFISKAAPIFQVCTALVTLLVGLFGLFDVLIDFVSNRNILVILFRILMVICLLSFGVLNLGYFVFHLIESGSDLETDMMTVFVENFFISTLLTFSAVAVILMTKQLFHLSGVPSHIWSIRPDVFEETTMTVEMHRSCWNTAN